MQPSPVPRHLLHRPVTIADAAASGVGRSRLRMPDVAHPFQGVHVIGSIPRTHLERILAARPLLTEGRALSHASAALLWGAELPDEALDGPVHVSVPRGRTPPRRRGVVGHTVVGWEPEERRGLPVLGAAAVWAQLAGEISREDLVAVGDRFLSGERRDDGTRTRPVATLEQLEAAAARARSGRADLEWALPRLRTGVDSRPESRGRLLFAAAGLPEPIVSPAIDVGERMLHPDLGLLRWRILFDFEGDGHRVGRRQWILDLDRQQLFEAADYRYVRMSSDDVFEAPQRFIARVRRIIAQQIARGVDSGE